MAIKGEIQGGSKVKVLNWRRGDGHLNAASAACMHPASAMHSACARGLARSACCMRLQGASPASDPPRLRA